MNLESIAIGASMALAASAGLAMPGRQTPPRFPVATLVVAILTIAGFAVQSTVPGALDAFQRNGTAIAGGEGTRLFTALFFQDGGMAGFVSNLAGLLIIGALAEQVVSRRAWVGFYFVPALACEAIALAWQPIGAGNSVAWLGLASALFFLAIRQRSDRRLLAVGLVGLAIGMGLSIMENIHGPAILLGVVLAWAIGRTAPAALRLRGVT